MRTHHTFWGYIAFGLLGTLLLAGADRGAAIPPRGPQVTTPATGGLPQCQVTLAACQVFPGDGVTGPALSYHDNGDGTITDLNTGLMWEKKVDSAFDVTCTGTLHAVHAGCTWVQATGVWIAAINAEGGTGYAGHHDWRVPNVKELQSIVDYGTYALAIDNNFGPTAFFYWSSTLFAAPLQVSPGAAWYVAFADGNVFTQFVNVQNSVRAVRGGP